MTVKCENEMNDRFDSSRFSDSGSMYGMDLASSPLRNHPSMSHSRDDTDFYLEKWKNYFWNTPPCLPNFAFKHELADKVRVHQFQRGGGVCVCVFSMRGNWRCVCPCVCVWWVASELKMQQPLTLPITLFLWVKWFSWLFFIKVFILAPSAGRGLSHSSQDAGGWEAHSV